MTTYSSLGRTVAHLAFLALFPGFFFYQSALSLGLIGPFLGGYFSAATIAFLPVLLLFYLLQAHRAKLGFMKIDRVFFGFLGYFLFIVGFNFATGGEREVVVHHLLSIVHFIVVFVAFRLADFDSAWMKRAMLLCLLAMAALIFVMSGDGVSYLDNQTASDESSVATYQGFARSYLVTFIALAPFIRSRIWLRLLGAISIAALYLNGARSELMVSIALVLVFEFFYAKHKMVMLLAAIALFASLVFLIDDIVQLLPRNRTLELLESNSSSSWETRNMLFVHALNTIAAHPIFGDYGSYVAVHGSGSYVHNIFSAWVDIGLFGFIYLLGMTLTPMYLLSIDFAFKWKKGQSRELLLAFCLMLVTLLMLFSAKSFTYMLIGAALARYAHYRSKNVHAQGRSSHVRSPSLRRANLPQAMPQPRIARL